MKPHRRLGSRLGGLFSATALLAAPLAAQDAPRPEDTEVWAPTPPVVDPGPAPDVAGPPPSDAAVLFGEGGLGEWVNVRDGEPAAWRVENGTLTVDKSVGDIMTRRRFRDYQLHLEWLIPEGITGEGQGRGNSGLFLAYLGKDRGGYELQILDSFENETYVNGMAGSVYKQSSPLADASRPPGEWQTYDVVWIAPRFAADGTLVSPARLTAFHNGVLVQNDFELEGETVYRGEPEYHPFERAAIMLQAHGDPSPPISFRNIWVRELGERPAPATTP
ncbi:MAG: 3-keto-disaccharide hydrolase [Gemmatimonadota bacterium]